MSHPHVPHPRELLPGSGRALRRANDWAAVRLAAVYGAAATIWVFTAYSVLSGLAKGNAQVTLLTWSNGVQLVFCAVMTYVGRQLGKSQDAKADADHAALTHIATTVDEVKAALGAGKDGAQ